MRDVIASLQNPMLKEIRKAIARGTLTSSGCAVAESIHLLDEAIRSRCAIPAVICTEAASQKVGRLVARMRETRVSVVPDATFQEISATETSQGVVALVQPPAWTLDSLFSERSLLLLLDGVQDPGNAGTSVRSAEAFQASGVMFLKGTVSPYNPKTLRASAGSIFRLPMIAGLTPEAAIAELSERGVPLYAATPGSKHNLDQVELSRPCAIAVGGEGGGVSETMRRAAMDLAIPTTGVESLNAAVAASIILYEASRQRRAVAEATQ